MCHPPLPLRGISSYAIPIPTHLFRNIITWITQPSYHTRKRPLTASMISEAEKKLLKTWLLMSLTTCINSFWPWALAVLYLSLVIHFILPQFHVLLENRVNSHHQSTKYRLNALNLPCSGSLEKLSLALFMIKWTGFEKKKNKVTQKSRPCCNSS